jgi:hypothetical protein
MAVGFNIRKISRRINIYEARVLLCSTLFENYAKSLGTTDIGITLLQRVSTADGFSVKEIELKVGPQYVLSFFGEGQPEAILTVTATYGKRGFDPDEKVTRRQVVFEIIRLWESLLPSLPVLANYGNPNLITQDRMVSALDVLKDTYSFAELCDVWSTPEGVPYASFDMGALKNLINSVPPIAKLKAPANDVFGLGDFDFEKGDLWAV